MDCTTSEKVWAFLTGALLAAGLLIGARLFAWVVIAL